MINPETMETTDDQGVRLKDFIVTQLWRWNASRFTFEGADDPDFGDTELVSNFWDKDRKRMRFPPLKYWEDNLWVINDNSVQQQMIRHYNTNLDDKSVTKASAPKPVPPVSKTKHFSEDDDEDEEHPDSQ
jgi:hypothetical protein